MMLNNPDSVYERKRTSGLLKVKRMKTADLPIVGFEEAIDGENKGWTAIPHVGARGWRGHGERVVGTDG